VTTKTSVKLINNKNDHYTKGSHCCLTKGSLAARQKKTIVASQKPTICHVQEYDSTLLHFSAVVPFLDLVVFLDLGAFFFSVFTLLVLIILDAVVSGMCLVGGRLELM
jgi:hypothetical protein